MLANFKIDVIRVTASRIGACKRFVSYCEIISFPFLKASFFKFELGV